jgi:hypothetical protein
VTVSTTLIQSPSTLHLNSNTSELRQSLVDLEEFFDILQTQSDLPDGSQDLPPVPASFTGSGAHAAAAAAAAVVAAGASHSAVQAAERLESHGMASSSNGSSSNGSSSNGTSSSSNGSSNGSSTRDASVSWGRTVGLEVDVEDVRFGYRPEREVGLHISVSVVCGGALS